MKATDRWLVAQLGARRHYAVPGIFTESGILDRLYTDLCAVKGWPRLLCAVPKRFRSEGIRRLLARVPRGVPSDKITSFTSFGWDYYQRIRCSRTRAEFSAAILWGGRRFNELIVESGFGDATAVYAFNGAARELFEAARARGLRCILDQTMVPFETERQLLNEEHVRWPGWETSLEEDVNHDESCARERAEWELADIIVCGSPYDVEGIKACGGDERKCRVVPRGVELPGATPLPADKPAESPGVQSRPLRVLTLGAVGLRKGSPYVLEAAKQLNGQAHFRMVGTIGVTAEAECALRRSVELAGPVPRSEVRHHLEWCDVLLLPSVCEGSATVTYEALSLGRPVVSTPNTGSIVRNGEDGFLVPIRDADAIAKCLGRLIADPLLLQSMSDAASARIGETTVQAYGERLLKALQC